MGLGAIFAGARARVGLLNSAMAFEAPLPEQQVKKQDATSKGIAARLAYAQLWRQATAMLMTGPQATPPRSSTVRRMIRLLAAKGPHTQGARIRRGSTWVHPTKSRAAWS